MAGSATMTEPVTALMPVGTAPAKKPTVTGPLVPAAPMWMCAAVGAASPRQASAKPTWLPWIRTTATARPSGSAGGTSLLPRRSAARNTGPAATGAGTCAWAWLPARVTIPAVVETMSARTSLDFVIVLILPRYRHAGYRHAPMAVRVQRWALMSDSAENAGVAQ